MTFLYQCILQFEALSSCRQQGNNVRRFAIEFSGAAEGLGYNDAALKDLFNSALDEPLSWWRMRGLDHLNFGQFVDSLVHSPSQVVGYEATAPPVAADGAAVPLVTAVEAAVHPGMPRLVCKLEDPPMRSPTESAPEPAPAREATESAPEPAPVREPTESAPEPAPPREPTESAPEPASFREPTESALQSPLRSGSRRSPLQSPLRSWSPWSPLRSGSPCRPLRSGSPRSPLRSGSPRSPLQSLLRSGSTQTLLQNPLRSGSPCSPLQPWTLRSGNPQSPLQGQPHPGTPVCPLLPALFHSTGLAHLPPRHFSV